MAASDAMKPSYPFDSSEIEIAGEIEYFMSGALVGKPKLVIQRAIPRKYEAVLRCYTLAKPGRLKSFRLFLSCKRSGRSDFLLQNVWKKLSAEFLFADIRTMRIIQFITNR